MPKSVKQNPKKLARDREDLMTACKHRRIAVTKMKSVPLIRSHFADELLQCFSAKNARKPESIRPNRHSLSVGALDGFQRVSQAFQNNPEVHLVSLGLHNWDDLTEGFEALSVDNANDAAIDDIDFVRSKREDAPEGAQAGIGSAFPGDNFFDDVAWQYTATPEPREPPRGLNLHYAGGRLGLQKPGVFDPVSRKNLPGEGDVEMGSASNRSM